MKEMESSKPPRIMMYTWVVGVGRQVRWTGTWWWYGEKQHEEEKNEKRTHVAAGFGRYILVGFGDEHGGGESMQGVVMGSCVVVVLYIEFLRRGEVGRASGGSGGKAMHGPHGKDTSYIQWWYIRRYYVVIV